MSRITLNFSVYPLVVGQFDKYTFSGWEEEGGSIQLKAEIEDDTYTAKDITWTSSKEDVAVVTDGLVRALTVGIADITAALPDGDRAMCRIQVIDNIGRLTPRRVSLNTKRLVLNKLDGAQLYPVYTPTDYFENGMLDKTLQWSSSNPQTVMVDHRGRVFGRECGTAVITGISNDIGRKVSCEVEVIKKKKADLYIDPLEDMNGGQVTLQPQTTRRLMLPEGTENQPVCWCCENASIASVDDAGNVSAYRAGRTTVWATFVNGGHRAGYEIIVEKQSTPQIQNIYLNRRRLYLEKNGQGSIYAAVFPASLLEYSLDWESSDESVVQIERQHINLSGLDEVFVRALSEGEAVIRAVDKENHSVCAQCCVTVVPEPVKVSGITMAGELMIQTEQVFGLQPRVNDEAADSKLLWLSKDRTIATVDKDGVVKGYEEGCVEVCAVAADSLSEKEQETLAMLSQMKQPGKHPRMAEELDRILQHAVYAVCKVNVKQGSACLYNLHIPDESITEHSVSLLWNRKSLLDTEDFCEYIIYHNGQKLAQTKRISYTVRDLQPETKHTFEVVAVTKTGDELYRQSVCAHTKSEPTVILDVTKAPYHALGNGVATDTIPIQRAIDDCPKGGVVLLPAGYVFYSGALFLKSDMSFQVDGILFGSQDPDDYPPVVCRWEGYRKLRLTEENERITTPVFEENVYSHSSLINAGVYDEGEAGKLSPIHTENIRICGSGMINANGFSLSYNEGPCWYIYLKGLPSPQSPKRDQNIRGRVIAIYNAKNVYVSDLTVAYGPSWTIHPVFCENVTFDNLKVISMGNGRTGVTEGMLTLNGDGIDPDSCTHINIMGCYFTVGDDAVAVKSGRNRQGNELAKPSAYIRVTDCICKDAKGSFCIGSEQAGGAHDILFQNLYVEHLTNFGLWIKSAPCRGGLVEDVLFRDCLLKDTGGAMQIEYNHGGDEDPSLVLPETRRITFENIRIQGRNKFGIRIMGVEGSPIHDITLRGFSYEDNFEAYKERKFVLSNCKDIRFMDAGLPQGYEWEQE